jgi:hypothetical protein
LGYLSVPTKAGYNLVGYNDMSYIRLLPHPEDMYTYSGQCSFRSYNQFYKVIGWHTEGINAGEEELDMCRRYNALKNPPEILWPGNIPFHFQTGIADNIGMNLSQNSIEPSK